jgi:hypothetical protein
MDIEEIDDEEVEVLETPEVKLDPVQEAEKGLALLKKLKPPFRPDLGSMFWILVGQRGQPEGLKKLFPKMTWSGLRAAQLALVHHEETDPTFRKLLMLHLGKELVYAKPWEVAATVIALEKGFKGVKLFRRLKIHKVS